MIHVNVKWGREVFKDVELDMSDESPHDFKIKLFSLTGVVPDRQRLIKAGKIIGDAWGDQSDKIKEGSLLMMMGSQMEIPVIRRKRSPRSLSRRLLDDIISNRRQVSEVISTISVNRKKTGFTAGLKNLGNTCYLNAVVQLLYTASELRQLLRTHPLKESASNKEVLKALLNLWDEMETTSGSVRPIALLEKLRVAYPDFGNTDQMGLNIQQDANECLQVMLRFCCDACLLDPKNPTRNLYDEMFGIDFNVTYKNLDDADDPITTGSEHHRLLNCYITQEVKYMYNGIKLRFKDTVKKQAAGTGVDATFLKTMTVTRLPRYLLITFIRFFYKGGPQRINAKILKDVKFPMKLDMIELCGEELQTKLEPMRQKIRSYDSSIENDDYLNPCDCLDLSQRPLPVIDTEPMDLEGDFGSNNSGMYELNGVITHKGRSASSGHYVAWINSSPPGQPYHWQEFDDDTISNVMDTQIMDLSGGGDWHSAYVLLYRARTIPKLAESATFENRPNTDGSEAQQNNEN